MLYSVFNEHLRFYESELSHGRIARSDKLLARQCPATLLLWASREANLRNQKVMLFDCIGRSGWTRTIDLALIRRAL